MSSRHGLEIRTATPADAPFLAELLADCGQPIPAADLAVRLERLQRAPGIALLALEWGPPSGIIVLHWYAGLASSHPVAEVTMLLVGPAERRRGLARLLLKAASQAARAAGCHEIGMQAPGCAPELLAFCEATGFVQDGAKLRGFLRRPLRRGGRDAGA